jgi:hypothetical protein
MHVTAGAPHSGEAVPCHRELWFTWILFIVGSVPFVAASSKMPQAWDSRSSGTTGLHQDTGRGTVTAVLIVDSYPWWCLWNGPSHRRGYPWGTAMVVMTTTCSCSFSRCQKAEVHQSWSSKALKRRSTEVPKHQSAEALWKHVFVSWPPVTDSCKRAGQNSRQPATSHDSEISKINEFPLQLFRQVAVRAKRSTFLLL